MSGSQTDGSPWEMERLYAERVAHEHELIAQRMSWLMTSNGFLIAGAAVLLSNGDKLSSTAALQALLLAVGILGLVSNGSSYFSNFWATKGGIRGAGQVLDAYWQELPTGEREQRRTAMRLFGRDPRALGLRHVSPPSGILHPWFALPVTFGIVFVLLPLFAPEFLPPGDRLPTVFRFLQLLPLVVALVLIRRDKAFHARRDAARRSLNGVVPPVPADRSGDTPDPV